MESQDGRHEAHLVEWFVAVPSAIIVLGMIGILGYEGLMTKHPKPQLGVSIGPIEETRGTFRVEFHAHNDGDMTAAEVEIEGQLTQDGQIVESSTTTLPYVPVDAVRRGALLFQNDPNGYQLKMYPKSYQNP